MTEKYRYRFAMACLACATILFLALIAGMAYTETHGVNAPAATSTSPKGTNQK